MEPHMVVMVTCRRQMEATLARLLGIESAGCCCRLPLAEALQVPRPASLVIDVVELFPRPAAIDPEFVPRALPRLLVLAFQEDSDALLSAASEGIPFHILEDLSPSALRRLVAPFGPSLHLYQALGSLAAKRVRSLLLRRGDLPELTRRESQVLDLAGNGHSNLEIARLLGVEPKTVKNCLTRAYRKLGISGRQEVAALVSGVRSSTRA